MHWLRIANDIVHDLSAGLWPGAAVAVWLVRRGAEAGLTSATVNVSPIAYGAVFPVMVAALAALVVTGLVRLGYRGVRGSPKTLVRTVLIKHAAFSSVFILATALAIRTVSR
jgi:putative copper export protein